MTGQFQESWSKIRWVLLILAAVFVLNWLFTPGFFRILIKDGHLYGSVVDIVDRAAPVMLIALGMSLVIATGGVDLSVGAVMAITGSLAAKLIVEAQYGFPLMLLFCLGAGALLGVWNGALVAFLGVQPIVATLILMVAGRGIAQLITGGQIITFENPPLVFLGSGFFLGVPFTFTLVLVCTAGMYLLLRKTALGLFVEAVGDNETGSRYSGINARWIKCFAYGASGFFAGLAGLKPPYGKKTMASVKRQMR